MLGVIGGLGLLGKIASPSTFRVPVLVGLGPLMYLLAFADGFGIHLVVPLYTTLPPTNVRTDTVFGNSSAGTVKIS